MIAATLYVIALIGFHAALPMIHVWVIAAVFSILMNFTYMVEAFAQRRLFATEFFVATGLVIASILGVLLHPLFVIAAILGHGLWDLAKHYGAGIPFLGWYTLSCSAIDFSYGAALLIYFLHF